MTQQLTHLNKTKRNLKQGDREKIICLIHISKYVLDFSSLMRFLYKSMTF